jgi:hypothetical protein
MCSATNQQQSFPSSASAVSSALSLDLQVLTLLLRRNSAAHHRARYYRRLQMMVRCLERYGLHDASACFFEGFLSPIRTEVEWIQSMADRDRRKRARGVEDKWTTSPAAAAIAKKRKSSQEDDEVTSSNETNEETSLLTSQVTNLAQLITRHLPEVLSRIMYAAEGLYTELSRGYFVPFCTVALAAISRIRALLMRMGREGCIDLGRCLTAIDNVLEVDGAKAIDGELWHEKLDLVRLKRLLEKIRNNNCLREDTGWGDWTSKLMNIFVEIDPRQHEKEQQEIRRQALRRGISDVSASSTSKMPQKSSKCTRSSDAESDDFDGDSDGDDQKSNDGVIPKQSPGGGDNDLGESVDIGQNDNLVLEWDDSLAKKDKKRKGISSDAVDANEEILQMMKKKSWSKSARAGGDGTGLRNDNDKPRKKKRKQVKLEQSTRASSIDDIFEGLDDDEERSSMPEGTRKEKKKAKKVKKVKKDKKKKSSKRNAVDDIFDGL